MDLKLIGTTFVSVFLAELGDKTQLATLTFASEARSRWEVFIGSASALILTSAIAVLAGEGVSRLVPAAWIKRAAGVVFILLGAWLLWAATKGDR